VCIEDQRNRIPGSNNRTRRVPNGKGKGRGSHELANTAVYQGCTKVPGTGKLLLTICQRLHQNYQATTPVSQKRGKVEVGKKAGGSICPT